MREPQTYTFALVMKDIKRNGRWFSSAFVDIQKGGQVHFAKGERRQVIFRAISHLLNDAFQDDEPEPLSTEATPTEEPAEEKGQ